MHANPKLDQIATNQAELEGAIAVLQKGHSESSELLIEHLKCAKVYLLGGMPEEYGIELEMAKENAADLPDPDVRRSTSETITRLRERAAKSYETQHTETRGNSPVRHRTPPNTSDQRGRLWDFFGKTPVKMGTFYPTSFVAAGLPTYEAAENALQALRAVGFEDSDAIAVRGEEMSAFLAALRERTGAWGELMASLSRTIGTEQLFTDVNTDLARGGAGFLFVYSPGEEEGKRIRETVKPFGPTFMQRYMPAAVEGLIKPAGVKGPER